MADVTNTPRRATGTTGTICQESGPYASGGNARVGDVIIFLSKGQRFPSDIGGSGTTWTLVSDGQRLSEGKLLKEAAPEAEMQ